MEFDGSLRPMPSPSPSAEHELRRARPVLGTTVEIRAVAKLPAADIHRAIDAAFGTIERIQRLMSFQDPHSELSRLNQRRSGRDQHVEPETYTVLEAALEFARLSCGAFDPCVGAQLAQRGYRPRHAEADTASGSWRDIELAGPGRVRLHRPVCLDLSGIAKGYAVDCACEVLQAMGTDRIMVNAGGDLRVAGHWSQEVRLRHPKAPHCGVHVLRLRNRALATSAGYYSRRVGAGGTELSALIDPNRKAPYLGDDSVSVQARDCMSADALTKIVLFAAPQLAERALAVCDARAFIQSAAAAA